MAMKTPFLFCFAVWEAVRAAGYTCDFSPSVGVQRQGVDGTLSGSAVIEKGDFLWTDFGIIAMGLWTDTQHQGYVLRDFETEMPVVFTICTRTMALTLRSEP